MTIQPSREIAFPFHIGQDGGIAFVEDPLRAAFQHVVVALLTSPGERVMLPTFGSTTQSYVFENLDEGTAVEIALMVQQALNAWVPEVRILDVAPAMDDVNDGALLLQITYSVPPREDPMTTVVDVGGAIAGGTDG